jgi:acetyltransferase-like isoleucine patch superfamily enzyme
MKAALKAAADGLAVLAVLPLVALAKALGWLTTPTQGFQAGAQAVSLAPGVPGNYLRRAYYRLTLRRCAADVCIEFGTVFSRPTAELGRRVYIGMRCTVGACVIEDDVLIGSNVDLLSGKHQHRFDDLDLPIREQGGRIETIRLGPDCWIGNASVVMADVGAQSVVAAGSVVVEAVEPRVVVGGNPARFLRKRERVAS